MIEEHNKENLGEIHLPPIGCKCIDFGDGQSGLLWKEDEAGFKSYVCTAPW